MKLLNTFALLFFSVFLLGCPDMGWKQVIQDPEEEQTLIFGCRTNYIFPPMEAGVFGYHIWIRSIPEFIDLPRSKPILIGPGTLYHEEVDLTTDPFTRTLIPIDEIETYYSNGMDLIYRPPSNDEVPPEGVEVAFACEVLNPLTEKWERSPDYTMRVVPRYEPMEFWIRSSSYDKENHIYGPDNSFSYATVTAGKIYERFILVAEPPPPDGVIKLEYSLVLPEGYSGEPGKLELEPERMFGPSWWSCNYKAPDNITSPVDIVARFSIYDPWIKERRVRELTFHVVPK